MTEIPFKQLQSYRTPVYNCKQHLALLKQTFFDINADRFFSLLARLKTRADFHFFHRRGGKVLGGVQVICNMPFLMLWKGHEMANQCAPGE